VHHITSICYKLTQLQQPEHWQAETRERERETISLSLMHAWILDSGRESIDELMSNEEAPKFGE
jgi:hypothetical protein